MKISFFMRHAGYMRNFEPVIRMFAARGHQVDLVFDMQGKPDPAVLQRYVEELAESDPNITHRRFKKAGKTLRGVIAYQMRSAIDYLRYFEPLYDSAPKLRMRASQSVTEWLRTIINILAPYRIAREVLKKLFRRIDAVVPIRPEAGGYLRKFRPDLVLLTPLVDMGSGQVEYLRAAQAKGIKTCLCVSSWDNLTNKGVIKTMPDLVTVWNEAQKREAIELHGVEPGKVVVTGAQSYDHWFEWGPSCNRDDFLRKVGLRADRPYILYLCSSEFIAPQEPKFVIRWIEKLRKSDDERLNTAGILVRPHPGNTKPWQDADFRDFENVTIYPRSGANPINRDSRSDYFDSIFYSEVVVGVNTSAQVEASILGKPIHTILDPEFAETQEGTVHFHLLMNVNGGLLHIAKDLDQHAEMLARQFNETGQRDERARRFVEAFVRPHGISRPAAEFFVSALEELERRPILLKPKKEAKWVKPLRPVLMAFAVFLLPDAVIQWAWGRGRARLGKRVMPRAKPMPGEPGKP